MKPKLRKTLSDNAVLTGLKPQASYHENVAQMKKLTARFEKISRRRSLFGKTRNKNPHLNGCPRIITIQLKARSNPVNKPILRKALFDVASSDAGRRHIWLPNAEIIGHVEEFKKSEELPKNVVPILTDTWCHDALQKGYSNRFPDVPLIRLLEKILYFEGPSWEPEAWFIFGAGSGVPFEFDGGLTDSLAQLCQKTGFVVWIPDSEGTSIINHWRGVRDFFGFPIPIPQIQQIPNWIRDGSLVDS